MTHCAIVHDIPGRMRLRFACAEAFSAQAPALAHNLATVGIALTSLRPYLPQHPPSGGVSHDSQRH
ncbi:MAG: hypothetical protein B193_0684 [Solidesulfovibrio magneticus str. Maddingley MBC34]|uniref:Uncharacterized protein n=1 Tax=Solidesulfovibrio magneticus str. Maddingley MBC34 TaxID=1206767 RepID=K6FQ01_9BACT|nr:MAG: hypothetical protein B193_0684 [Solidesulfovibrio magneticus str. Maddingley MBC34]